MTYYHAFVAFNESDRAFECVFADLLERDLRRQFVRPISVNDDLIADGRLIRRADIAAVRIQATEQSAEVELQRLRKTSNEEIDRFNSDTFGPYLVSIGHGHSRDDLCLLGKDVTAKYLSGSLKARSALFRNNPWTVGIGVLMTGIVLTWLLRLR